MEFQTRLLQGSLQLELRIAQERTGLYGELPQPATASLSGL